MRLGRGAARRNDGCDLLRSSRGPGALILGWNDLPNCKPFEPMSSTAFGRFDRMEFPDLRGVPGMRRLGRGDYLVKDDYQHVFSFFEKR